MSLSCFAVYKMLSPQWSLLILIISHLGLDIFMFPPISVDVLSALAEVSQLTNGEPGLKLGYFGYTASCMQATPHLKHSSYMKSHKKISTLKDKGHLTTYLMAPKRNRMLYMGGDKLTPSPVWQKLPGIWVNEETFQICLSLAPPMQAPH